MRDTLRSILSDRDLAAVTFNHFLLYLFFIWAPLYVPLYLHEVLGIAWSQLGWVFFVMLIPYVIIEYPAGFIADRWLGDKEIMFVGFILAGLSLAAIGFVTTVTPIVYIAIILIGSRVGAAMVESMTESHFFRRVSEKDVNAVSVFRGIWPLADLIAPVVGSLLLISGNYTLLFFVTGGFITIAGMSATLCIKDFR
jgi:MFS family permease